MVEIILVVTLSLLAVTAVMSVATVVATTALAVTTLATTPISHGMRRRRWHHWHPSTSWLPDDEHRAAPMPVPRGRAGTIEALTVVSARDPGVDMHLVAARIVPAAADPSPTAGPTRTLVHASLEPTTRLELPAHEGFHIVVYVVAGQGTIGTQQLPVCAGQVVILGNSAPVRVTAGRNRSPAPLEVLVLGELPAHPRLPWTGPIVVAGGALIQQRLKALQTLVRTRPTIAGPVSAPDPAPCCTSRVHAGVASTAEAMSTAPSVSWGPRATRTGIRSPEEDLAMQDR